MGARFLSSTGLGSGNLIGRAQSPPAPALDKNRSPTSGDLEGSFALYVSWLVFWADMLWGRGLVQRAHVFALDFRRQVVTNGVLLHGRARVESLQQIGHLLWKLMMSHRCCPERRTDRAQRLSCVRELRKIARYFQEWPRQTKPKKGQFMNFSRGHSGTKVQCESCLFS